VYLLGAIEPAQRVVVDRHLATCRSCRAELSGLAGLPSLLRRVPGDVIRRQIAHTVQAMPELPLTALLARTAAIRRRSRLLAVAAAVVTGIAAAKGQRTIRLSWRGAQDLGAA
jgi:predicted anti-sigma-YlaC factor YlaD